jgi:hypothetical protein
MRVLELMGQFAKLDSMFLRDGGPPRETAGWWHAPCLAASGFAEAWADVRLRNVREVRGYTKVADTIWWTVLRLPRTGAVVAIGRSAIALSLSRFGGQRPRRIEGGAVYRIDDEYNFDLDDLDTIASIKRSLLEAGRYPLTELAAVLGISDRLSHPEALADAALRFDKQLQQHWLAGAVSVRIEYGVFVPDELLPHVPSAAAESRRRR